MYTYTDAHIDTHALIAYESDLCLMRIPKS